MTLYRNQLTLLLTLLLAVVISGVAVTWSQYTTRTTFQQLQALQAEQEEADTLWKKLTIERSTWATPDRVERIAREQLRMTVPAADKVVILHVE